MTNNELLFSIVIPTRDRPQVVSYAIKSALQQTYKNIEIIVCDNFGKASCRSVVDSFSDARLKYYAPKESLSMADNWEWAMSLTKGDYVIYLIDKTVLLPETVAHINEAARKKNYDIVSFRNEPYFIHSMDDFNKGWCNPEFINEPGKEYDPKLELKRRISFVERRENEKEKYFYGKICFGAYSRALISKIMTHNKAIFLPISPDYTSATAALAFANSAYDIGKTLLLSFGNLGVSNGAQCRVNPAFALGFFKTIHNWKEIVPKMPIPYFYPGQHNGVAYDYQSVIALSGLDQNEFKLDLVNLYVRTIEDLEFLIWADEKERDIQLGNIKLFYESLSSEERNKADALLGESKQKGEESLKRKISLRYKVTILMKKLYYNMVLGKKFEDENMKKILSKFSRKFNFNSILDAAEGLTKGLEIQQ